MIASRLCSRIPLIPRSSFNTIRSFSGVSDLPCFSSSEQEEDADGFLSSRLSSFGSVAALCGLPLSSSVLMESAASGGAASAPAAAKAATVASVSAPVATVLSILPPACFGFLQLSGLKTVREIRERGTVGDLNPLQFVSLATNCFVWTLYGAMRWDMTVLLPNFTGLLFGLYYTSVYAKYSTSSIMAYVGTGAAISAAVVGMAATLPTATAAHYIGLTGCTLAVILMSSPLATMAQVIRTQNTSSIPLITSIATFGNAVSWASYGWFVANDPLIWGPNSLGLAAATVQLGLFARYGVHTAAPEEPASLEDGQGKEA